jgi:hypothetical protein
MRCTQVLVGDAVSAFGGAAADHAMPRARSGSAHTAGEPTGQTRLLIVPTLAWLNVFMEVHMRIKMYLHMAG